MNICCIVFSPSGHTREAGEKVRRIMTARGMIVQLVDITRERMVFTENRMEEFLKNTVLPHDCLFVGGPVYAGHLEHNVKWVIDALPPPDAKWGRIAVPFVTYGGVHSSIALEEAGKLLHTSGRTVVSGMKLSGFHTLTHTFERQINLKGDGSHERIISDCASGLIEMETKGEYRDIRSSFAYAGFRERILFHLISQDRFHKKFRTTAVDGRACTGCGACVRACPQLLIKINDGKAIVADSGRCILCAECFHACTFSAMKFEYCDRVKPRLEAVSELESPLSRLFP